MDWGYKKRKQKSVTFKVRNSLTENAKRRQKYIYMIPDTHTAPSSGNAQKKTKIYEIGTGLGTVAKRGRVCHSDKFEFLFYFILFYLYKFK
jgi:hypothetical protein